MELRENVEADIDLCRSTKEIIVKVRIDICLFTPTFLNTIEHILESNWSGKNPAKDNDDS